MLSTWEIAVTEFEWHWNSDLKQQSKESDKNSIGCVKNSQNVTFVKIELKNLTVKTNKLFGFKYPSSENWNLLICLFNNNAVVDLIVILISMLMI